MLDAMIERKAPISDLKSIIQHPLFSWNDRIFVAKDEERFSLMERLITAGHRPGDQSHIETMIEMALDMGADPNEKTHKGVPVWYQAITWPAVLKLYLERGVNPNARFEVDGFPMFTPLMIAAGALLTPDKKNTRTLGEAVSLLHQYGAKLDTRYSSGDNTALHMAIKQGNLFVSELLVDLGANPTLKTDKKLPRDFAMQFSAPEWKAFSERLAAEEERWALSRLARPATLNRKSPRL